MLNKRLLLQLIITFSLAVGIFSQPNRVSRASKLHAPTAEWSVALSGQAVRESSPVLADITSAHAGNEIIVAGSDGRIYAYRANGINLWEYDTGSAIESSPAVSDIDGDGDMEIVVGLGSQYETGEDGGVVCLNRNGNQVWRFSDLEDRIATEAVAMDRMVIPTVCIPRQPSVTSTATGIWRSSLEPGTTGCAP